LSSRVLDDVVLQLLDMFLDNAALNVKPFLALVNDAGQLPHDIARERGYDEVASKLEVRSAA
jgi:hypothetical protein